MCGRLFTQKVFAKKSNSIAASLFLAVILWGANNVATKYVVGFWGPCWIGSTRLFCAGLCLLAILKWTRWLGKPSHLTAADKRELWLRGSLSLVFYIVAFTTAMHFTSPSHVALYLGTSPVWALLWDERPAMTLRSAQRYGAAALALTGVVVLFWPSLSAGGSKVVGEALGFAAGVLWANYGRQCRILGGKLSGVEVSAHTMWRAGLLLLPFGFLEIAKSGLLLRADIVLAQGYCILVGGVVAYSIWTNALRHWQTSQVYLFNNLIPLTTMGCAHFFLHEPVTHTFWVAMALVVAGVLLGQAKWQRVLGPRWVPLE